MQRASAASPHLRSPQRLRRAGVLAQAVFDDIHKTMPCEWLADTPPSISVLGEVTIRHPYKPEAPPRPRRDTTLPRRLPASPLPPTLGVLPPSLSPPRPSPPNRAQSRAPPPQMCEGSHPQTVARVKKVLEKVLTKIGAG